MMAMIPQAGCVLQFFSPLLFERLHQRKLSIWLLCATYRFSLSLTFLAPMALGAQDRAAEGLALVFYTIAFLTAALSRRGCST